MTRLMIEQQDYVDQYDLDNLAQHVYLFSLGGLKHYQSVDESTLKSTSTTDQ